MRLLFCAIAGREFGYGHLSRCLSIAAFARQQGLETVFLVIGDGAEIVRNQGFKLSQILWGEDLPQLSLGNEAEVTIAIIDLAHHSIFIRQSELLVLLQALRHSVKKIVAIDSLGDNSFAATMPKIPVDLLVIPYFGGIGNPAMPIPMLVGPEYALLSQDYAALPLRNVNKQADKVLVTFGGSDPLSITPVVLASLSAINQKLTVRVIIGPLFSEQTIRKIEIEAYKLEHSIELLYSPPGLIRHMQWADIAIAASGLVKYELAATGTPSILISIDEVHDLANKPFALQSLNKDLGVNVDPVIISQTIDKLLRNSEERRGMAERGQRLIDGKGVERLISSLKEFLK